MAYERILRLLAETPWAIRPAVLQAIVDLIALRASGDKLTAEEVDARVAAAKRGQNAAPAGPVAVLPLYGMIAPKATMFTDISGATSLDRFQQALSEAVADPTVQSVLIDTDSPGGLVTGVPEAAAAIRAARGRKPIVAIANAEAASAAYWLASQAGEFVVTPSGQVGSIGVYAAHEDISAALESQGVKISLVSAGEFKTEGNPYEPLSQEGRDYMQGMVNEYYGSFLSDVAKGRGVSVDQVSKSYGQGRMLTASKALQAGMVDRVATFEDTVRRMASGQVARGRQSAEDESLSFEAQTPAATVNLAHDTTPAEARERMGLPVLTENQTATETPDAADAAPADSDTKTLTREDRVRLFKLRA